MMLAAGLDGIENEIDPGDPRSENMYLLSQEELDERDVKVLPRTLLEATEAFDADDLGREVMGEDLARSWVQLKQREWWDFHNTVSTWELDHYLTKF
jgi:glutamine synthetase